MENVKAIFDIDFPTFIIWILIIIGGVKVVIESIKWVVGQFGIEFKHVRKRNEEHDLLMKTTGRINELENLQKKAVEESKKYDDVLRNDIEKIYESINNLTNKILDMEQKSDATERASLKDRIATLYRKYSTDKSWTEMERESFNGLIRDYEAHGGKNSFVHDICEPESFTWKVIDGEEEKKTNLKEVTKVWQV